MFQILEHEAMRGCDPKLVEQILTDVVDRSPGVGWDSIAGLAFAKQSVREITVLPLLRPDIFRGARRPPKGLLLFGPPGTGKTLIAKAIATEIGRPVMVKAQVKAGGRGKAGGVKYAATPEEAFTHASNILGLDIKGHVVKKLLVAEASDIAEEYYVSFLLDRANRTYLAMCSVEGGMEIEEVAATKPDRLAKVPVDAVKGVDVAFARSIAEQGHLPAEVLDAAAVTISKLWEVFVAEDATLVEVNPLVRTPDDRILALDGKVTLDGNAGFRHPDHAQFEDHDATDPLELKAKQHDLNYVKLDGAVGVIGNGAGLVMSTLDVVAYAG